MFSKVLALSYLKTDRDVYGNCHFGSNAGTFGIVRTFFIPTSSISRKAQQDISNSAMIWPEEMRSSASEMALFTELGNFERSLVSAFTA